MRAFCRTRSVFKVSISFWKLSCIELRRDLISKKYSGGAGGAAAGLGRGSLRFHESDLRFWGFGLG
jgi:hypothetical protein